MPPSEPRSQLPRTPCLRSSVEPRSDGPGPTLLRPGGRCYPRLDGYVPLRMLTAPDRYSSSLILTLRLASSSAASSAATMPESVSL